MVESSRDPFPDLFRGLFVNSVKTEGTRKMADNRTRHGLQIIVECSLLEFVGMHQTRNVRLVSHDETLQAGYILWLV